MTGPQNETHLLTPTEVRDLLRISRTTLFEWKKAKRLTAVPLWDGGPERYPADQAVIARALKAVAR